MGAARAKTRSVAAAAFQAGAGRGTHRVLRPAVQLGMRLLRGAANKRETHNVVNHRVASYHVAIDAAPETNACAYADAPMSGPRAAHASTRRTLGGVSDERIVVSGPRVDAGNANGALNENAAAVAIARVVCRQVAHAFCDGLPLVVVVVRAGSEVNIVMKWALRRVLRPGGVDDA